MKDDWIKCDDGMPSSACDGAEVLVWLADECCAAIATWDHEKRFARNGFIGEPNTNITHWQPIIGP